MNWVDGSDTASLQRTAALRLPPAQPAVIPAKAGIHPAQSTIARYFNPQLSVGEAAILSVRMGAAML